MPVLRSRQGPIPARRWKTKNPRSNRNRGRPASNEPRLQVALVTYDYANALNDMAHQIHVRIPLAASPTPVNTFFRQVFRGR